MLSTKLGSGSFGEIYELPEGRALKVYKDDFGCPSTSIAEVDILFRLNSPHLLSGKAIMGPCGYLLDEWHDTLAVSFERLFKIGSLIQSKIKPILYGVAMGLKCLHDNNYLHLDISRDNVMWGGSRSAPVGYLIDYGSALGSQRDAKNRLIPVRTSELRTTPSYRCLEGFFPDKEAKYTYSDKSDVWSLALVMLELITGSPPVSYSYNHIMVNSEGQYDYDATAYKQLSILTNPKTIEATIWDQLNNVVSESALLTSLLVHMLKLDPRRRYSVEQVISHPYFEEFKSTSLNHSQQLSLEIKPNPDQDHSALIRMIGTLSSHFGSADVEMLFVAIDIYMRTVNWDPEIERVQLMSIALAYRLFHTIGTDEPLFRDADCWSYEVEYLKALGGVLRHSRLYKLASNLQQLRAVYFKFLDLATRDPGHLNYDTLEVPDTSSSETGSKACRISDFVPITVRMTRREAFNYLSQLMLELKPGLNTRAYFMALDIYLRIFRRGRGRFKYQVLAQVSLIVSLQKCYGFIAAEANLPDPKSNSILEATKFVFRSLGSTTYSNLVYTKMDLMDELRIIHDQYFKTGAVVEKHTYAGLRSRLFNLPATLRLRYKLNPRSKRTSVKTMLTSPFPSRRE